MNTGCPARSIATHADFRVGMSTLIYVIARPPTMLRAGQPVFFGSDVGKFSNSTSGIMDLELIDYELGFNVTLLGMDKASRLRTGESQMTHAMVLTGVHVDETSGETVRWRVQNSWGTDAGVGGWFVMSDRWIGIDVAALTCHPRGLRWSHIAQRS